MSSMLEEFESKLSLVVRKPQEGKTSICIANIIRDKSRDIHIVITMNTLGSNMQFFGRMQEEIGAKNIIVYNSKSGTEGSCHHSKTNDKIMKLLNENPTIKVIVCCAHEKKIRDSLPELFTCANDSKRFEQQRIKFVLHIDEAHKYITENKDIIRDFNANHIIKSIIGYTATPDRIWSKKESDPLFHKILIRDVEEELQIIRSPEYFGVKNCNFITYETELNSKQFREEIMLFGDIDYNIPEFILERANGSSVKTYYEEDYCFDLGNEMLLLCYLNFVLSKLKLDNKKFSYNFIPAYTRKVTHYAAAEIAFKYYPNANVIVMNGNGIELFNYNTKTNNSYLSHITLDKLKEKYGPDDKRLLEPSFVIQELIKYTPNVPTFLTGNTCVGMSVTCINPTILNFDNVIMAHHHYSDDKLYQLCRFLFNYTSWPLESKQQIKITKFHSLTQSVINTCLNYECHVEKMCEDFAGQECTLREINGGESEPPNERELKKIELSSIVSKDTKIWKKYKVYDGNDSEMWRKVYQDYCHIKGIIFDDISEKSKPSKQYRGKNNIENNENDKYPEFYKCSTTGGLKVHTISDIVSLEKQSWWSTFMLMESEYNYVRLFVGYDNLTDPTEYTIYMKFIQLNSSDSNVKKYIGHWGKKNASSNSESDDDKSIENDE